MQVETLSIPDVKLVRPVRHGDARGWFEETYRADRYASAGIGDVFVQDNQSFSARKGTVRGLHFQLAPFAQSKLVRVLSGAILDVVVDLRRSSPTFGHHVTVRLDAAGGAQLYVPMGFAHGFCTLEPDTGIAYKVGAHYSRDHDRGIRWNDPDLGIDWPVTPDGAELSDKDRIAPFLRDVGPVFD
jgi:dTDP-4-dehydrorhamnose 3,5-epimerase